MTRRRLRAHNSRGWSGRKSWLVRGLSGSSLCQNNQFICGSLATSVSCPLFSFFFFQAVKRSKMSELNKVVNQVKTIEIYSQASIVSIEALKWTVAEREGSSIGEHDTVHSSIWTELRNQFGNKSPMMWWQQEMAWKQSERSSWTNGGEEEQLKWVLNNDQRSFFTTKTVKSPSKSTNALESKSSLWNDCNYSIYLFQAYIKC